MSSETRQLPVWRYVWDTPLGELLPASIGNDPLFASAAEAATTLVRQTALAAPALLIFDRLDYERGADSLMPPLARVATAAGGLAPLSGAMLELLAWQLHVDFRELAKNEAELIDLVRGSIPWHRIKGTPAALVMALGWFGITARVDESGTGLYWAVYELEIAELPPLEARRDIVRVAEETAPARCWLRRLHNEYDRRPIVLDVGPALDFGMLDDDSGVWDADTGLKLSFGNKRFLGVAPYAEGEPYTRVTVSTLLSARSRYHDKVRLDHWRLDSEIVNDYPINATPARLLSGAPCNPQAALPPELRRAISMSQLALDTVRVDCPWHTLDRRSEKSGEGGAQERLKGRVAFGRAALQTCAWITTSKGE